MAEVPSTQTAAFSVHNFQTIKQENPIITIDDVDSVGVNALSVFKINCFPSTSKKLFIENLVRSVQMWEHPENGDLNQINILVNQFNEHLARRGLSYNDDDYHVAGGSGGGSTTGSWVWTYYGGFNPNPKHYLRNSFITSAFILTLGAMVFKFSASVERRVRYPDKWIPSMLWAAEFHDPASVEMWKKQLKFEGREWIEPIPDWWPFKK